jgi:hypothetical protein
MESIATTAESYFGTLTVVCSEMLAHQIEEFKAGCTEHLADLQAKLAALQEADARDRSAFGRN